MKSSSHAVSRRRAKPVRGKVNGKVPPLRVPNAQRREREYLVPDEVGRLLKAAQSAGRHGKRDYALILTAYRHALRVNELVGLRWAQIDFDERIPGSKRCGTLSVTRLKGGAPSKHPLPGVVRVALQALSDDAQDEYVFANERGGPLSADAVRKIVARAGDLAGLGNIHPHMLRHSCGYKLVNDGTDLRMLAAFMGHRSMQSTMRYAEVDVRRFTGLWSD